MNIEEYNVTQCYHNNVSRDSTVIELDQCEDEAVTVSNDQSEVLDNTNITNAAMQVSTVSACGKFHQPDALFHLLNTSALL